MAFEITTLPNTNAPDASYPSGSAKDVSAPAATDGTPIEKQVYNDIQGILQRLILEAGITPSGVPDTVLASDYYDALMFIIERQLGLDGIRSFATVAAMKAATDLSIGDNINPKVAKLNPKLITFSPNFLRSFNHKTGNIIKGKSLNPAPNPIHTYAQFFFLSLHNHKLASIKAVGMISNWPMA